VSWQERQPLIARLEQLRDSKLLVYVTGDRRGLETKIASDVFPMFHRHLTKIGQQKKIDLFLYSTGGEIIAGYALVNLIREFCEQFGVIVPFKALSCATLISLGANEIIMTPMGQLSPIDPSVGHPLGPVVQMPGQPVPRIAPVSVEDVNAFVDLAKKEVGLSKEESLKVVFELLASKIHPLALGAVQRSREQIAFLASSLIKYHCSDEAKINDVVNILTRERFSHSYLIGRTEAERVLGLDIVRPDAGLTQAIVDLFGAYAALLELDAPYNPETVLGTSDSGVYDFPRALIESAELSHCFKTRKEVCRVKVQQPGMPGPVVGYQERVLQEEWAVGTI